MKILKYVSVLISLFTPLLLIIIIFNGFMIFLYNINLNLIYFLLLFLIIINNIIILKINNTYNHFLFYAKISLFSNYGTAFITFFPFLGFLWMLPGYVSLVLEHFPNFLINYSDNIKLIFMLGVCITLLLIWHIIIILISFIYYSKFIKIQYNGERNKIVKYCVLYFVPIINILILVKNGKKKI
jgi:hypothetical protein